MVSVKSLYVPSLVKPVIPYTGKLTKELNKRKEAKLKRKSKELEKHLPSGKYDTPINQD
jgi:hypothetical protein